METFLILCLGAAAGWFFGTGFYRHQARMYQELRAFLLERRRDLLRDFDKENEGG